MLLTDYAKTFLGKPYLWGGSTPLIGFDCSGLCLELLKSVGLAPLSDMTAQSLYEHLKANGSASTLAEGAFCFYGKSTSQVSHIAYMINAQQIIEAGGGDSHTVDFEHAIQQEAFVRIRHYMHRKDLLEVIMPFYPVWVTERWVTSG